MALNVNGLKCYVKQNELKDFCYNQKPFKPGRTFYLTCGSAYVIGEIGNLKTDKMKLKIFNLHQFETRLSDIITEASFISSITFVFQFSSESAFIHMLIQHRYYIS